MCGPAYNARQVLFFFFPFSLSEVHMPPFQSDKTFFFHLFEVRHEMARIAQHVCINLAGRMSPH
jgi:hypothetical protein